MSETTGTYEPVGRDHARPTPRQTARLTAGLAAVFAPALWLAYSRLWVPRLMEDAYWQRGELTIIEGWISVALCGLIGFGSAILVAIAVLNRRRLRLMFHPTTPKVITSCAFALLTPISLILGLPFPLWMASFALSDPAVMAGTGHLQQIIGLSAPVIVGSYVIVSLVIYGVRRHILRLPIFLLIWLALYAVQLLRVGIYTGPI